MKILVVNNGTHHLNQLKERLSGHITDVVDFSDINVDAVQHYQSVILTGGHDFPVFGNDRLIEKEIRLIQNSDKPIFGICLGFEAIAYAFGSKLEILKEKTRGLVKINVVEQNEIFSQMTDFEVYESHRWIVKKAGPELQVLAISKDGIEAIKHRSRPIYGVQFHPEILEKGKNNADILSNFLRLAESIDEINS